MAGHLHKSARFRKPYFHRPGLVETEEMAEEPEWSLTEYLKNGASMVQASKSESFEKSTLNTHPTFSNQIIDTSQIGNMAKRAHSDTAPMPSETAYVGIIMGIMFGLAFLGAVAGWIYNYYRRKRIQNGPIEHTDRTELRRIIRSSEFSASKIVSHPIRATHLATGTPEHSYFPDHPVILPYGSAFRKGSVKSSQAYDSKHIPLITSQVVDRNGQQVTAEHLKENPSEASTPKHRSQRLPLRDFVRVTPQIEPAKLRVPVATQQPIVQSRRLVRPHAPPLTIHTQSPHLQKFKPFYIPQNALKDLPALPQERATTPLFTPQQSPVQDWSEFNIGLVKRQEQLSKQGGILGQEDSLLATDSSIKPLSPGRIVEAEQAESSSLGAARLAKNQQVALEMLEGVRKPRLASTRDVETTPEIKLRRDRIKELRKMDLVDG